MGASGWNLTGRLISKHFSGLGDKLAETIAGFDPLTATEADRDRLRAQLMETAQKLAKAKAMYKKEQDEVIALEKLIASDEKVAEQLAEKLASGALTEDAVMRFCDEMEAEKARLPTEKQEAQDAKEYMDQLQEIVDAFSKALSEFDAQAKKNILALEQAKAKKDMQALRLQRQAEVDSLSGVAKASTAMTALTRQAQKVSAEADGMKIVADIQQKPLDDAKAIDDIRKLVTVPASESASERLQRLLKKPE